MTNAVAHLQVSVVARGRLHLRMMGAFKSSRCPTEESYLDFSPKSAPGDISCFAITYSGDEIEIRQRVLAASTSHNRICVRHSHFAASSIMSLSPSNPRQSKVICIHISALRRYLVQSL